MGNNEKESMELQKFFEKVSHVFSKVEYPIHDAQALINALGGKDATITWEGRKVPVAHGRNLVFDQYFPINSKEELLSIAANLELQRPGNKLVPISMGKMLKPTSDKKPPEQHVGDPMFLEKLKGYHGPSLAKGIHKK